MIYFKENFKILSFSMLTLLLICSCGSDGSGESTSTNAPEKETKAENTPKVIEASLTTKKIESTPVKEEVKKPEPVKEKPKTVVKKEKPKKKVRKPRAKMVFDEPTHNYGFIMQGDSVRHNFSFKNTGDDDLLITRVHPSCGCTTPDYPKEAIPPGKSGMISVLFNSTGKLGRQNPNVEVYTNYKRKLVLKLEGFVDAERAKPPVIKEEMKVDTATGKL